jgi:hypothetical protein
VTNPFVMGMGTCELIVRFVGQVGGPYTPVVKTLTVTTIYGSATSTLVGTTLPQ